MSQTTGSKDNLKKFGSSFQSKVIAGLLSDKTFLERIYDIVDKEYFEEIAQQWIVEEIISYFLLYKSLPTLDVFKVKIQAIENIVLKKSIIDQLKLVYSNISSDDIKYVNEQFLEFCKNQKVKKAIMDSVDYLNIGDYDSIKAAIDAASKAGVERNFGHDYLNDFNVRMENISRNCIKTGWKDIDILLDGGLGAGEFGVIIGAAGTGKSWQLMRFGAEALKQGKNVVHFTLELSENYVGKRYDAYFSGIPFQDITKNKETVREIVDKVPGKLYIKYYPLKTVSAQSLKFYIEKFESLNGYKIDLMIIDYPDILRSVDSNKNNNSYTEAGNVYEEIRSVLGELQIPGWGASQTNREGSQSEIIQAHNISDSFRKVMTADVLISFSRMLNDKNNGTARFHLIKNRFGADGLTFSSRMNASTGHTELYNDDSPEGMKIASEISEAEGNQKNFLKEKWNAHKKSDF
jgi:replicative DNA helicase